MSDFFSKLRKTIKKIEKITDNFEEENNEIEYKDEKNGDETPKSSRTDVRERLSVAELSRITGLPFDTYKDYLDDEWEGGVYTISDPNYHVYFQIWFARKDIDGYNPDGVLDYYKEVMPGLELVSDIGDIAFWSDSKTLFIQSGLDVLQASSNSDSEITLETIKKLVRKLI